MRIILINGMPGSGKSTLAAKLVDDLGIPCMSKDMIKEFLFDRIGVDTFNDSRFLGKVSIKMLYAMLEEYIKNEKPLIIENAFYAEFARHDLAAIFKGHDVELIEIYCETGETERHRRISDRIASGERHPGHHDKLTLLEVSPDTYAPLALSRVVHYDTSSDETTSYADLLKILQ
ncbi:MAG TPA: ATP-binding protein [Candidatus Saccharimonadales bacterium]